MSVMVEALGVIAQISQASSPFLLALAVWAFATGRVVPRWLYDASERRSEEWKRLALGQQPLTDRSLDVAERIVRREPAA